MIEGRVPIAQVRMGTGEFMRLRIAIEVIDLEVFSGGLFERQDRVA